MNFIRENINVPQENLITTKESGHELDKENQDPGIMRFKRLAKSPGSVAGKRKKGESEQSEETRKFVRTILPTKVVPRKRKLHGTC